MSVKGRQSWDFPNHLRDEAMIYPVGGIHIRPALRNVLTRGFSHKKQVEGWVCDVNNLGLSSHSSHPHCWAPEWEVTPPAQ